MLAGQTIWGFCLSLTVTVNEQLVVLFAASVTLQVTVVVPFWKVEPDEGEQATLPIPEQLSEAAGGV
jgi:hypothetical protein